MVPWTTATVPVHESTMDSWRGGWRGSPDLGRLATPADGSSLRRRANGEGSNMVLTKGGAGRWTAGGEPAIMGNKWVMTELGGKAIRAWVEQAHARNGKVLWRRCSRVPFIGRGQRKGGGPMR
jgi:hypothetical protein